MTIGRDKMVGGSARLVARRKRVGSLPFRSASAGSLADPNVWRVGVRHLKRRDPVLARIISGTGPLRFELDDDHYEAIVVSIVFQQLAGSAAGASWVWFRGVCGGRL